jgi:hypothetical protein
MGQMRVDGMRTTIREDGTVTVPGSEEQDAEPVVVGKLSRDGGKWVAQRDGERKKESFPRRREALAHLVAGRG